MPTKTSTGKTYRRPSVSGRRWRTPEVRARVNLRRANENALGLFLRGETRVDVPSPFLGSFIMTSQYEDLVVRQFVLWIQPRLSKAKLDLPEEFKVFLDEYRRRFALPPALLLKPVSEHKGTPGHPKGKVMAKTQRILDSFRKTNNLDKTAKETLPPGGSLLQHRDACKRAIERHLAVSVRKSRRPTPPKIV